MTSRMSEFIRLDRSVVTRGEYRGLAGGVRQASRWTNAGPPDEVIPGTSTSGSCGGAGPVTSRQ
jgi:hypothetical protein